MNLGRVLVFLFLVFGSKALKAQRIITGRLMDFHTKEYVSGVPVVVFKGTECGVSNESGYFQLTVKPGDSLVISHQLYNLSVMPAPEHEVFILYIEKRYVYPEYTAGEAALYKYLKENIKYPAMANLKGKEEFLLVQVAIDSTGVISGYKLLNEASKEFEKPVLAAFSSIPGQWSPIPQKAFLIFPVLFKTGWEQTTYEIPKIDFPEGKIMDAITIYAYL